MNKTILDTKEKDTYKWYVVDANAKNLGRLSSEISKFYLGKIQLIIVLIRLVKIP